MDLVQPAQVLPIQWVEIQLAKTVHQTAYPVIHLQIVQHAIIIT